MGWGINNPVLWTLLQGRGIDELPLLMLLYRWGINHPVLRTPLQGRGIDELPFWIMVLFNSNFVCSKIIQSCGQFFLKKRKWFCDSETTPSCGHPSLKKGGELTSYFCKGRL